MATKPEDDGVMKVSAPDLSVPSGGMSVSRTTLMVTFRLLFGKALLYLRTSLTYSRLPLERMVVMSNLLVCLQMQLPPCCWHANELQTLHVGSGYLSCPPPHCLRCRSSTR